ncbi:MAG: Uma2 family endonuclease [Elainellaceae cyanobacterium]
MTQTPTKRLTLEEFLNLPETTPASEYLDGDIIQKPMPQGKHSLLQRELSFAITLAFKPEQTAQAFPELRCTYPSGSHPTDVYGGRSIVPDIAVFLTQRIPRDPNGQVANSFNTAPDWIIEILSPQQSQTQVIRNIFHSLDHGTEMGWLLDPEESFIFVYGADKSVQGFEATETILPVPAFAEAVQLRADEIFAWLQA